MSGSGARPLGRGSAPSSAARDRRCILIGLSVRISLDQVDVACFSVCKCINDPNDVCIVFAGCLDGMIGGNIDDRTCDQGRSGTCGQAVAAVLICSRSRRIWKSIRLDYVSSVAAASNGMSCNPFQIHGFPTSRDCEALEAIRMRGAPALTVPQIVHPYPVAALNRFPRLYRP